MFSSSPTTAGDRVPSSEHLPSDSILSSRPSMGYVYPERIDQLFPFPEDSDFEALEAIRQLIPKPHVSYEESATDLALLRAAVGQGSTVDQPHLPDLKDIFKIGQKPRDQLAQHQQQQEERRRELQERFSIVPSLINNTAPPKKPRVGPQYQAVLPPCAPPRLPPQERSPGSD